MNHERRAKFAGSILKRQQNVNMMNVTLDANNFRQSPLSDIRFAKSRSALKSIKKRRDTDIFFIKTASSEFNSTMNSRKRTMDFMQQQFRVATLFWNETSKCAEKAKRANPSPLFSKAAEKLLACKSDPFHVLRVKSEAKKLSNNELRLIDGIKNRIIRKKVNGSVVRKKLHINQKTSYDGKVPTNANCLNDYQLFPSKYRKNNLFVCTRPRAHTNSLTSTNNSKQTTCYGNFMLQNLPEGRRRFTTGSNKKDDLMRQKHKRVVINLSIKIVNALQNIVSNS
eukprot:TRINITY_DN18931_c0_g1_i3.p1 TRINITY_DN18931_c0_g1~~TRINITY_DN18931_c0_g1_i3.p1  ORF type:complete len:282 (-),score=36.47 TRINITY_DN18931_c0_g1_i3:148-993(-)